MSKVVTQAQAEYAAGHRRGLAGGEEPRREKGRSYWLGWSNGRAEREEQQMDGNANDKPEQQ